MVILPNTQNSMDSISNVEVLNIINLEECEVMKIIKRRKLEYLGLILRRHRYSIPQLILNRKIGIGYGFQFFASGLVYQQKANKIKKDIVKLLWRLSIFKFAHDTERRRSIKIIV